MLLGQSILKMLAQLKWNLPYICCGQNLHAGHLMLKG